MKVKKIIYKQGYFKCAFEYEPWEKQIINWFKADYFYEPQIYKQKIYLVDDIEQKVLHMQNCKFLILLSNYVSFFSLKLMETSEEG